MNPKMGVVATVSALCRGLICTMVLNPVRVFVPQHVTHAVHCNGMALALRHLNLTGVCSRRTWRWRRDESNVLMPSAPQWLTGRTRSRMRRQGWPRCQNKTEGHLRYQSMKAKPIQLIQWHLWDTWVMIQLRHLWANCKHLLTWTDSRACLQLHSFRWAV